MGQYNRLGKRRAGGAWQWLIIGFFPGLLCGGLVILLLFLTGIFEGLGGEPEVIEITSPPLQIVNVVTATPDPNASPEVQIITTTPEPVEEGNVQAPTLEPVVVNTVETEEATAEETATPAVMQDVGTEGDAGSQNVAPTSAPADSQAVESNIPAELAGIAGNLVRVEGGIFQYGTDAIEIAQAVGECSSRDSGTCQASDAEDSTPRVPVLLDTFWIEQDEVTFEQYVAFLNYQNSLGLRHTTGCQGFLCIQTQNERPTATVITFDGANYRIPSNYQTLTDHPAYGVTWYGALTYCQALGRRLPTEAEWEYAARAGGQNISYPWNNSWGVTNANVRQPNIEGTGVSTVSVNDSAYVGGINSLGLSHMAGNVAEWVNDYYSPTYYQTLSAQQIASGEAVPNPTGPAGGTERVLRGGSFNSLPFFARTFHRQSRFPAPETPEETYPLWVGFRCASDTGAATTAPAQSGAVSPSDLQVPATGDDSNDNAQPTADVPEESESDSGSDARG